MKKIFFAFIILLFYTNILGESYKIKSKDLILLPNGNRFTGFLEAYAPDITMLIEESNGFAFLDRSRIYFEGSSFTNFDWMIDGQLINSSLNPGSASVQVSNFFYSALRLESENIFENKINNGLNYITSKENKNFSQLSISGVLPKISGFKPYATFLIDTPAIDRDDILYQKRRQFKHNYSINYSLNKVKSKSASKYSISYEENKRRFNDFNIFNKTFQDKGKLFILDTQYIKEEEHKTKKLFSVFNYKERSADGAETGLLPQETKKLKSFSGLLSGVIKTNKGNNYGINLQFEKEERKAPQEIFYKDLADNDGDSIFPKHNYGDYSALGLNLNMQQNIIKKDKIKNLFYLNTRLSYIKAKEKTIQSIGFSFKDKPYLMFRGKDKKENYNYLHNNLKTGFNTSLNLNKIILSTRIGLSYNSAILPDDINNFNFIFPHLDFGIKTYFSSKLNLSLSTTLKATEIKENISSFLSSKGSYGAYYTWEDKNKDKIIDEDEQGDLYSYTGAKFHFKDKNLQTPYEWSTKLLLNYKISQNWSFKFKALYKEFYKNFRVTYGDNYGFYQNIDNNNLFFLHTPPSKFILRNREKGSKTPYYGQFYFQFLGSKRKKWKFSFSFMTHIGMGTSIFGNGPCSNDLGIIDESMANPNSLINGFGRMDGDRAFVAKIFYLKYIGQRLSIGISAKYRDGNPFAFINSLYDYNQFIFWQMSIKAADFKNKGNGPREDYLSEVNLQFNYHFKIKENNCYLSLGLYNILDAGYELSENVFSQDKLRLPNELNIPPSIRLSLILQF